MSLKQLKTEKESPGLFLYFLYYNNGYLESEMQFSQKTYTNFLNTNSNVLNIKYS